MISKSEVKYIQSLYHKKNRDAAGLFVAEGVKLAEEVLSGGFEIKNIYATKEWVTKSCAVPVTIVEQHELEKISNLSTPNQVLIIAGQKIPAHEPLQKNTVTLVLDGLQDPGNLGTIIRIADWFGISQIVANTDTADVYNPKVIQASMGSIARVHIWYRPLEQWLQQITIPVYGALLQGKSVYQTTKISEGVIVIGNESKGIRENILPMIRHAVSIPAKGSAESLNAAVATGIILSHLL